MDPEDRSVPGDTGGEWTKEQPQRDRPFDFDAFLGPESLADQVTDVLDGKDVLDEEACGTYPPGYIPRRGAPGDRGRHEAPEPEKEPEYPGDPPTKRFTKEEPSEPAAPEPPRQSAPPRPPVIPDAPPRPKVVVAEPAPRVVVTPERQYPEQKPTRQGMGKGMKFLIALLISAAVILAVGVLAVTFLPGLRGGGTQPPAPSPTDYLFGGLPTWAPRPPAATEPPTAPPATAGPTPPVMVYHTITVTAGTGGSVNPSGLVEVQDGGSVTFTIAPYAGYDLTQLLVNGSNVPLTGSYTFGPVYGDGTIYAVFQPLPATEPPATDVPVTDPPPATEEPAQPPVDQGQPEEPPPAAG